MLAVTAAIEAGDAEMARALVEPMADPFDAEMSSLLDVIDELEERER